MHETIIAKNIIDEAKKYGKVKYIVLDVGDLAHVPSEDLLETLSKMVDWKIKVNNKKAKIKCACGFIGKPIILEKSHNNNIYRCSRCKQLMPEIIEGNSIILKEVKIE